MGAKKTIKGVGGKLTRQQEMFVQAIIAGHGQAEAYRIAYPKSNSWTDSSVNTEAYRLIRKPHVAARYEELRDRYQKHIEFASFYGREELLFDFLYLKEKSEESIDDVGVRQANSNAYVNALKNIGEILSLYPDKKVDLNASISSDFEINILGDMSEATDNEVIEGTCEEAEEILELDEVFEMPLLFPQVEKESVAAEVVGDDNGEDAEDKHR